MANVFELKTIHKANNAVLQASSATEYDEWISALKKYQVDLKK